MRANCGPIVGLSGYLPFNRSFFCCVDLCSRWYVTEQKAFDVVEEESLGVGVGKVEAVMVDDLSLFLQPFAPASLADFSSNALAERVWKRGEREARALFAAMSAFDVVRHFFLLIGRISPDRTVETYTSFCAALIAASVASSFGLNKPIGRTSL